MTFTDVTTVVTDASVRHVEDLVHASAFSHALRELAEGVSGL